MSNYRVKLAWRLVPRVAVEAHKNHAAEIKRAFETNDFAKLGALGEVLQLHPGQPLGIPNHPSPLASMLVGGLGGAALGYGAGWLGEKVLPRDWRRGNMRLSGAAAGGMLGASPGLLWGAWNAGAGLPFNAGIQSGDPVDESVLEPWSESYGVTPEQYDHAVGEWRSDLKKSAAAPLLSGTGLFRGEEEGAELQGLAPINVARFNDMIWRDPRVAGPLDPATQAAASGLILGAANLPGKPNTRLVTPFDVGRMAAGMGSGFLSGALVGRALGILMGMPEAAQDRLKSTGTMAGLITNLVPMAFGG